VRNATGNLSEIPRRSPAAAKLLFAGLLLALLGSGSAGAVERLRIAAERTDGRCVQGSKTLVLARLAAAPSPEEPAASCLFSVRLADYGDAGIQQASGWLSALHSAAGVLLELPAPTDPVRFAYAVKLLSSAFRAGSPEEPVGLAVETPLSAEMEEELSPYVDALALRDGHQATPLQSIAGRWVLARARSTGDPASDLLRAIAKEPGDGPSFSRAVLFQDAQAPVELTDAGSQALARLQAYLTNDVSRDPTATRATRKDGSPAVLARFFDGKKFTPILFLPADPAGIVRIELSGGPFTKASVENLASGAKRDFDVKGAKILDLDLSKGPLAAVLQPAERPGGATRTKVEVGAERGLTADEIIARERAWDAGQRAAFNSYVAHLKTSLRFRIAEVNETFDLTILGPVFYRRGESADWEWDEFYLNGVKWKGKTLPRLPILQPEKVTAIPLDIRLTEDYEYSLKGEGTMSDRPAYHVAYAPKQQVSDKPAYRGSVWIDKETFALLRRDSVQLNLKGETLSAVQTEIYRQVPGRPDVSLPLEIKGEEVYSTAGRTTAIERKVEVQSIVVDPPDFDTLRAQAYASPSQMIRHTDNGMRYLVPNPEHAGERIVEEKISKKSTFGVLGAFYDDSLDFPLPLVGIQHFNFDLWGKGKQLSVFFAGALLTANYTDPALAGSRFDLGADLFAVAFPFGDVSYRNGQEVKSEKIKHLPAVFQLNVGHPIGPYLKASLGIFSKWDNFQRDSDTGPDFVTPVDTFTDGAELKLVANFSGFNIVAAGSGYRRRKWEFWGDPATSEFNPDQQDYQKWSLSVAKDQYFSGFRKLHLGVSYLGGHDLDRFSKYEFGSFSGNPVRGYKSGSLRTQEAFIANISYGLNIENIIRFEGFYDQAVLNDKKSGFDNTYYSGAGLLASLNGPWSNTLVRAEVGVPVVSHGIHGVVINLILLKLF